MNYHSNYDNRPLVTIITVCRNSEKTIRQTIESVFAQSYSKIEYIVIDGGSTDGTINILDEYRRSRPECFKFISEPDPGLYFAMNKGIQLATGELIGIINSDDIYCANAIPEAVSLWTESDRPEMVLFSTALMDDWFVEPRTVAKSFIDVPNRRVQIPHPSAFISQKAYTKYGVFNTFYRYAADRELLTRFVYAGATFSISDMIAANFRQGGLGSRIGVRAQVENFALDRKYVGLLVACKNFLFSYCYSLYRVVRGKVLSADRA